MAELAEAEARVRAQGGMSNDEVGIHVKCIDRSLDIVKRDCFARARMPALRSQ